MTTTIDPLYVITFTLIASVFALLGIGVFLIFRNTDNPKERKSRITLGFALFVAAGILYFMTPRIASFLYGAVIGTL